MAGATALAFVLYSMIVALLATASIALWHTLLPEYGVIIAWWAVVLLLTFAMLVALHFHRNNLRLRHQKDSQNIERKGGNESAMLGILQGASQASEIARHTIRTHPNSSLLLAAALGFTLARKNNDLGSLIRLALRLL